MTWKYIKDGDKPELYKEIFVANLIAKNQGKKVVEYLRAVPIIVRDVDGNDVFVFDGNNRPLRNVVAWTYIDDIDSDKI